MKTRLATPVLMLCVLFLAMTTGAGLYQHMFDIPRMLSSPAMFKEAGNNDLGQAQMFWMPLHALTLITLIFSFVLNRRDPARKKWIGFALGAFIYIMLVSVYFASRLSVFQNMPDTAAFHEQTHMWLILSWHRPLLQIACIIALMTAISKPAIGRPSVVGR